MPRHHVATPLCRLPFWIFALLLWLQGYTSAAPEGCSSAEDGAEGHCQAQLSEKDDEEDLLATQIAAVQEVFGSPKERHDEWCAAAMEQLHATSPALDKEVREAVQRALTDLRKPLTRAVVAHAFEELEYAKNQTGEANLVMTKLWGRFLFQYYDLLRLSQGSSLLSAIDDVMEALKGHFGKGLGVLRGTLQLTRDGTHLQAAMQDFAKEFQSVTDGDEGDYIALVYGLALAGSGQDLRAVQVLESQMARKKQARESSSAALSEFAVAVRFTFAFLAGTSQDIPDDKASAMQAAFSEAAATGNRTRAGALAAVCKASLHNQVPFQSCQKLFLMQRDMVFRPDSCAKFFDMAILLYEQQNVPEAVQEGRRMFHEFPFHCVEKAEKLSEMGQHWLTASGGTSETLGFGGNLQAFAEMRIGLRAAVYATMLPQVLAGEKDISHEQWHLFSDNAWARKHVRELERSQSGLRTCKAEPSRTSVPPPVEDPLGCMEVKPDKFANECLKAHRPCVIRRSVSMFLKKKDPEKKKDGAVPKALRRWLAVASNASVRTSFPFSPQPDADVGTLNSLQPTTDFYAKEEIQRALDKAGAKAPDHQMMPFTLVRPAGIHMTFKDAVSWAMHNNSNEFYMNQAMVADLGPSAIEEVRTPQWISSTGLVLLNPSLWLTSGHCLTGYHRDGPENLLVQLAGEKDVFLLRPTEQRQLYYLAMENVQAGLKMHSNGSFELKGYALRHMNTTTHSAVDPSSPGQARRFPGYRKARGLRCRLKAGDALYIPSYWHHAVETRPDHHCIGLSLNLWYGRREGSPKLPAVLKRWGGSEADLMSPPQDWL